MEDGMAAMFPNGIQTLVVDDDSKFVKSATELLSSLNFEVVACSNVAHALKSLTSGQHKGFDVILVHAAKAAAAGFDFRAIVEANLLIPVIYFLRQGHKATGDKRDKLLRALHTGTYVIKKPVDANEVRSLLWKVIAFRKCELEAKATRGRGGGLGVQGEDEGLIHFMAAKGGGRKRKCSSSNPAGSFFFAGTATAAAAGGHLAAKGKEKDNVQASLQQPAQLNADGPGKKAMMNGPQLNFFMNGAVPPFNPNFFSVADGPSSNASTFAGAVYSAAPSAIPPLAHQLQQQQQPRAHSTIFGNNITSAVPQPFFRGAIDGATMEWLLSDDFDDYVGGAPPLVAPNNQVLGRASNNVDEPNPTATTGSTNGASSMAPQEDLSGNNVEQVDVNHAGLMAPVMPPSDGQYEDNTFSLHGTLLRDLHGPLSEFDDIVDLDFLLGALTGFRAAATDDVDDAGTSLVAGEEGGSCMDGLGNLDGLQIPYDLLESFIVPCHRNWNNVHQ